MNHKRFRYRCGCGELSPAFDSREGSRGWHARHVRDCAGRSATATRALLARARRFEPIPVPEPALDAAALWGSPTRGGSFANGSMGLPGRRNVRFK